MQVISYHILNNQIGLDPVNLFLCMYIAVSPKNREMTYSFYIPVPLSWCQWVFF